MDTALHATIVMLALAGWIFCFTVCCCLAAGATNDRASE